MTPTTPASASVQSEQTRRPWAVFDSQGFYKLERSEVEARAFCDTYNARNPNDPLRPYTCCALDDVRPPQQPSATGGDGWLCKQCGSKDAPGPGGFGTNDCARCGTTDGVQSAPTSQPTSGVPVYLVATGEAHEGEETYTRHDECPPLCDAEKLWSAPQPAAARVGLSPEQIAQLWAFGWTGDRVKFVRAIEAAHGIASPQEDGGTAA